ncbi:MAG: hypothetical protein OXD39_03730 [Gemmatimonadetes bacterium]|nr:hypothetical protein [Gemmatimonadota bacterium]
MNKKNNLLLARFIQWISGGIAIIVIYPVFRLICPCWRRINGILNRQGTDAPRTSTTSRSHYNPSGTSITQGK